MILIFHENPFLNYFLDSVQIYSLYVMLALILLNAEMNKTDKRDQAPPRLHSNEEERGKRRYLFKVSYLFKKYLIYLSYLFKLK